MARSRPEKLRWDSLAERQIRQAQQAGYFDNLSGAGQPLADLDEPFDPLWWVKRLLKRERLSAAPPELELRKEVQARLRALETLTAEPAVRRELVALNTRIAKANATHATGPTGSLPMLDEALLLQRWRDARRRPTNACASSPHHHILQLSRSSVGFGSASPRRRRSD